jgi:hypothetical protein
LPGADRNVISEMTPGSHGVQYAPSLCAERDGFADVLASVRVCPVFTIGG